MVSVVVSIQVRKMFAEVRKMFSNARDAEQDVREGRLVRTSDMNHVRMNRPDKREVGSSTLPRPINQNLLPRSWIRP